MKMSHIKVRSYLVINRMSKIIKIVPNLLTNKIKHFHYKLNNNQRATNIFHNNLRTQSRAKLTKNLNKLSINNKDLKGLTQKEIKRVNFNPKRPSNRVKLTKRLSNNLKSPK